MVTGTQKQQEQQLFSSQFFFMHDGTLFILKILSSTQEKKTCGELVCSECSQAQPTNTKSCYYIHAAAAAAPVDDTATVMSEPFFTPACHAGWCSNSTPAQRLEKALRHVDASNIMNFDKTCVIDFMSSTLYSYTCHLRCKARNIISIP